MISATVEASTSCTPRRDHAKSTQAPFCMRVASPLAVVFRPTSTAGVVVDHIDESRDKPTE
eukprot:6211891-Pleurochrysis_carterae.AAC.5